MRKPRSGGKKGGKGLINRLVLLERIRNSEEQRKRFEFYKSYSLRPKDIQALYFNPNVRFVA